MATKKQIYEDYLLTPHWKNLREEKFKQVGKACQVCPSKQIIHVHHIRYKNLIDCTVDDVLPLCEVCHNDLHFASGHFKVDLIDKELPEIKRLIDCIRQSPRYANHQDKIERKRRKRAKALVFKPTASKPRTRKGKWSIDQRKYFHKWGMKRFVKRCVKEDFSTESLEALIFQAEKLISEAKEIMSRPKIETLIANFDAA